jgi:hypothetical protein
LFSREDLAKAYGISPAAIERHIATLKEKWGFEEADALAMIACAKDRYKAAMPYMLRVRDKDGKLVQMMPTRIHRKFKKFQRRIAYVVKPRQVYFTTFMEADNYLDAIEGSGIKVLFVNLDNRVTEEVFDRVHTFQNEFALKPLLPKTKRETTRKLSWKNGGSFDAITVKNDAGEAAARVAGRSCTQQRVHGTEVAFWEHYHAFMSGMLDSVPRDGQIVLESTGNGAQGGFYDDCMEIFEKGKPVAPGVWHLGEKSLHFVQWWDHPEYTRPDDPLLDPTLADQMEPRHRKMLAESEADHRAEMRKDRDLTPEAIEQAIYWRRGMLFTKGFLRDPDGSLKIMDREYPGTLRHAFQSTGSAFLSLSLTDLRREEWKRYNADHGLPLSGRVAKGLDGRYTMYPGSEDVFYWLPPCDLDKEPWEDRYCIGADVGGGNSDSDPDCIWVKDRLLNMYVAVSHGRWGPTKTAEIMMALGYLYHTARLCWETNNHGVGVSIKVWEAQYPNIYRHDDKAEEWKGMGFQTGERSRANALKLLKQVYEDKVRPWRNPYGEFYREAAAFAPPAGKPDGKVEGQNGVADDTMMAVAMAEVCDASYGPPQPIEAQVFHAPGTFGSIREMVGGHSGGLGNIL